MLDVAKMLADARLDRRAKHLAAITPHVPVFVCRNLLILADRDLAADALPCGEVQSASNRR
jgi:hypothetical protein